MQIINVFTGFTKVEIKFELVQLPKEAMFANKFWFVSVETSVRCLKTSEVNVSGMNQNKTRKHWRERERSEWVKWTTDWFVLK